MSAAPSIPFFNYPALFGRDEENFMGILRDMLRGAAFILQRDAAEFETALSDRLGVKHVIGVADGTSALILGLKALADDEVRRISDLIHAFYRGQE